MKATLVISPDCGFASLSARLSELGWRVASSAARPIVEGEPEYAVYERQAPGRIHYTFNPVCQLRVLEIPEDLDAVTRSALPAVGVDAVEAWLRSTEERTLLRGVLASRLLPDPRWSARLRDLVHHPRAAIAQAAAQAAAAQAGGGGGGGGRAEQDARAQALGILEMLKPQVEPLLLALSRDRSGEVLRSVRPRDEDYAKAFVGGAAELARKAYEPIWGAGDLGQFDLRHPDATQTVLTCDAAPAGMLAGDNELSRRFPGGYRGIAGLLDPHRVWVRWRLTRPGESAGMAYDGLVWLDDHWAWFPKPYRLLAAHQQQTPTSSE